MKHNNILRYHDHEIVDKTLYIYMEYMSLGSIAQ